MKESKKYIFIYCILIKQNKEILRKLGVSYLKPYQELIISHILECDENKRKGKILGCLPTGSGKSLCFMYPIAAIRKRTILIYPLLSLMNRRKTEEIAKAAYRH